jgi:hypothetical protein
VLVGSAASPLALIVFLRPCAFVIEIQPARYAVPNGLAETLAKVRGDLHHRVVLAPTAKDSPRCALGPRLRCHAAWDAMPRGMPCRVGCHAMPWRAARPPRVTSASQPALCAGPLALCGFVRATGAAQVLPACAAR